MMKRVLTVVLIGCFMLTAAVAFAEDVFATKRGKKYHKETCQTIQNSETSAMDKQAAVEKGLTPCSRCYKEDVQVLPAPQQ